MTRDAFQKPPPGHRWGRCSCNNELLRETFHSIPWHRMKKPRTADYTFMPQFNSLSPFLIRAWKYKPLHFLDDDGHRTGLKRDTARCPDLTQHIPCISQHEVLHSTTIPAIFCKTNEVNNNIHTRYLHDFHLGHPFYGILLQILEY